MGTRAVIFYDSFTKLEDVIGDERYDTPWKRAERPDEVNEMIAAWTRQHSKHEAMEIIGASGIPAGAVLDTMELSTDPTFEARGIMPVIDHPVSCKFKMVAWPVRFSGSPPPVQPAPLLGANNNDVLTNWLGLGAEQISGLHDESIIG